MASQPGKQANIIRILLNISKSTGNQAMKLGQLIEYNVRNIFLEKTYFRHFSKNSKLNISLDQ